MNAAQNPSPGATDGKRAATLSKDGAWRSFPKVPHLLQYVSNGTYYARVKMNGKIIRRSLETDVWSAAKLRLVDFLKAQRTRAPKAATMSFVEALNLYDAALESDTRVKPQSKQYRRGCIRKIQLSWPELWERRLDQIDAAACREWAARLSKEIASQYFNNTIATLRLIFDCGIRELVRRGGPPLENPAQELGRVRIRPKDLELPEREQFRALVENVRAKSGGWARRTGDLIEFLAYSGLRVNSEARWVTWEDIDWPRKEIIVRGDPKTGTKNSEIRRVAILPDMDLLLQRMGTNRPRTGRIVEAMKCREALARACRDVGVQRITQHDLRHLFATRCIEAGVDVPTVARWLGHKDGGALAMKTYGHLRNEHSRQMAEKVRF